MPGRGVCQPPGILSGFRQCVGDAISRGDIQLQPEQGGKRPVVPGSGRWNQRPGEKSCPDTSENPPGHCAAVPEIIPGLVGVPGFTVTAKLEAADVPHELPAVTAMFPFCPAFPEVTVILVVPCPAVIVQPVGTVQV